MRYLTRDGDMVDAICFKQYGDKPGVTELVLESNPFLADYGPILPAGVIIELPDLPQAPPVKSSIRLWD